LISFLVAMVAQALILVIIARAILSWFPGWRALTPITTPLDEVTTPILGPIRPRLPAFGGVDLSPLVAVLLIGVIESLVLGLLVGHQPRTQDRG
jgi:YggT family protein